MPTLSRLLGCLVVFIASLAVADLPVSPQVLDPKTPAEAWNVIRLSTANVSRLLREQRLQEVAQQISLCSPSLRLLASSAAPENRALIDAQTALAFRLVNELAQAAMSRGQQQAEAGFARLQAALDAMKPAFADDVVRSEIYVCPGHPEVLATSSGGRCGTCDLALRVRRIPYSDVYVSQTLSKFTLTLALENPIVSGSPAKLAARLQNPSGTPLLTSELLPLHGAPLHLILIDPRYEDFHLITPTPGVKPGEWDAVFTPARQGPYRVWAEIVPMDTSLPEYPMTDLGGEFRAGGGGPSEVANRLSSTANGFGFQVSFARGSTEPPPPRENSMMYLKVTDAAGQPVTSLEPFMNAFAHVTGIYDDGKTLLRIHPATGDILRDDLRGGPTLAFKIYPPQTGYIHFFCQVRIGGRILTVPLGMNIAK